MPDHLQINNLIDHLFRHESGKMISVLTRIFGPHHLELAEDVVHDTLLEAMNVWTYKGIPQNPEGWLHTVAKNKALNIINREKYKKEYAADIAHSPTSEWAETTSLGHLFDEQGVMDDQLRMIFTCCHPAISPDSQVALTLKTLCGFSVPEIANAFLTSEDTINKRLVRARQKIREANIPFVVPHESELKKRLDTVLEIIFLLFNEGYSSSVGEDLIRYNLCEEAIRLADLLAEHPTVDDQSSVYALLALMYLNASRFQSRQDREGNIIQMAEQNRDLWDKSMMSKGFFYLEKITSDGKLSAYHILATISALHCSAPDYASTDWGSILSLYDDLLYLDNSPLIKLNRSVVLSKVKGVKTAISELEKMKNEPALQSYHLYYSTLAEFYIQDKSFPKAIEHLNQAIQLSPLKAEKDLLTKRLELCKKHIL